MIGLLQGITELFPVSSLGHSVLVPSWLGWDTLVSGQAADESFYLAFLVGLHLATGVALLIYYRRDWSALAKGTLRTIRNRDLSDPDGRLASLLVIGTIPVGLVGLIFEHSLRTLFAKPLAAAVFLTLNGVILLAVESLRRRAPSEGASRSVPAAASPGSGLADLTIRDSLAIGTCQILALFAGISRSGITMAAGLARGLDRERAARFSFMLATPVILAAGVYKLHDLLGPNGAGLRGQILVGSLVAGLAAYAAVRFLERFFRANTLLPFAGYCLVFGGLSIICFA